jgi:hypothetical protein
MMVECLWLVLSINSMIITTFNLTSHGNNAIGIHPNYCCWNICDSIILHSRDISTDKEIRSNHTDKYNYGWSPKSGSWDRKDIFKLLSDLEISLFHIYDHSMLDGQRHFWSNTDYYPRFFGFDEDINSHTTEIQNRASILFTWYRRQKCKFVDIWRPCRLTI